MYLVDGYVIHSLRGAAWDGTPESGRDGKAVSSPPYAWPVRSAWGPVPVATRSNEICQEIVEQAAGTDIGAAPNHMSAGAGARIAWDGQPSPDRSRHGACGSYRYGASLPAWTTPASARRRVAARSDHDMRMSPVSGRANWRRATVVTYRPAERTGSVRLSW